MLVKQWDHDVSKYWSETTWCSTYPSPPTLTPGSVSGNWCFWWDNTMREKPFNPITSSCSDTGQIVSYSVTLPATLDQLYVKVSLNPYTNMIRLTGLTSGSGLAVSGL